MTSSTNLIVKLFYAANTIHLVPPTDRRDLIEQGIKTADELRKRLRLEGNMIAMVPHFMEDMPKLVEMAQRTDAVDAIIAAGMLMLAGEVQRLQVLNRATEEGDHLRG
jgi:uncharacterized protein Yka (UPF0111/DUF47 family)